MSDYATQLDDATRRLDELSAFNVTRAPQAESLAPRWFSTVEGLAYLDALQRGDDAQALNIWDQAYGRALDEWTTLLWLAPSPATKEDEPWEPI